MIGIDEVQADRLVANPDLAGAGIGQVDRLECVLTVRCTQHRRDDLQRQFQAIGFLGVNGQADAMKLGIARALMQFNAELRKKLKLSYG